MSKKLTDDLMALIFNSGQIMREEIRKVSDFADCSLAHMHTLHYIKDRGTATMKDLADSLHITPPSTTSLVNSLVNKGFVERATDKLDRRTIRLKITGAGLELLKRGSKRITNIIAKSIDKLNEQEKKNFIVILKKMSQ